MCSEDVALAALDRTGKARILEPVEWDDDEVRVSEWREEARVDLLVPVPDDADARLDARTLATDEERSLLPQRPHPGIELLRDVAVRRHRADRNEAEHRDRPQRAEVLEERDRPWRIRAIDDVGGPQRRVLRCLVADDDPEVGARVAERHLLGRLVEDRTPVRIGCVDDQQRRLDRRLHLWY